jgi:hypothetical protein
LGRGDQGKLAGKNSPAGSSGMPARFDLTGNSGARMVAGGLPETYEIETRELGSRAALEKVYEVVPEKQLNMKFRTNTERAKYGLGKGFPIAKASGEWFFVICMKPS